MHTVRVYEQGDDPRRIDWNASARTGEFQVRTTLADVALDVHLLPSYAPTMRFGTVGRKHDHAVEVLRFLAALASRRSDQVYLHLPGAHRVRLPGRHAAAAVEQQLTMPPSWDHIDDGATALDTLAGDDGRALLVVVVDLFASTETLAAIREQSSRRDVVAVLVHDPAELDLPSAGRLTLVDPMTGRRQRVNTDDATLVCRYRDAAARRRLDVLDALSGAFLLEVSTGEEVDAVLAEQLSRPR
jgi:uncharacterized protein (DUF58 family)